MMVNRTSSFSYANLASKRHYLYFGGLCASLCSQFFFTVGVFVIGWVQLLSYVIQEAYTAAG